MRQLSSLAVSCLKLAKFKVQRQQGSLAETAAWLNIAQHALAAALAHRSSAVAWHQAGTDAARHGMGSNAGTGSSSSSIQTADRTMGAQVVVHEAVLLVARGMHLAGTTLGDMLVKKAGDKAVTAALSLAGSGTAQLNSLAPRLPHSKADTAAAAASAAEHDGRAQVAATIGALLRSSTPAMQWLAEVLPAVELPGGPGSEQACAAARQQLLQLQGRLQQDLQETLEVMGNSRAYVTREASSGASGQAAAASMHEQPFAVAPEVPQLFKLIKAFGGALCTQFPLPHCCNNPGCVDLRGASELQLVGGKGCVCSRCRWV
jgi:hypothetical protein